MIHKKIALPEPFDRKVYEKELSQELIRLIQLALDDEITMVELMDEGLEVVEQALENDTEGYENDEHYTNLKEAESVLEDFHDDFVRRLYAKDRKYLQGLIDFLKA